MSGSWLQRQIESTLFKVLVALQKKEDKHYLDEEEARPYWINLDVRKFTWKQKLQIKKVGE